MSLPITRNPRGATAQPISVGGIEIIGTTSTQETGVDAPTRSLERGAEISQRNVVIPEQGTITGAAGGVALSGIRGLARRREPITISTPESTINNCVVENVSRTREGEHVDKYGIELTWRQVLLAQIGSVTIQATTGDGKKSKGSGDTSEVSLGESKSKSSSQGANTDTDGDLSDYFGRILDGLNLLND